MGRQEIREPLQRAQERQSKWHDQKRQPSPEYVTVEDVGQGRAKKADRVMLNRKDICTKRHMEKLDHKMFGPFVVKRKIGSRACKLELPARMNDPLSVQCRVVGALTRGSHRKTSGGDADIRYC